MKHKVVREDGYVPHAEIAIKIAIAVWEPIFSQARIEKQQPISAKLIDNKIWVVRGSLPQPKMLGGTMIAEICKQTGEIFRISHGR